MANQRVYLIRHGETEWSLSGQHTGTTDIPLTENGRTVAVMLREILSDEDFALVLTSPMRRSRETCELAGLADRAETDGDLMEWNYGEYEGLTPQQIHFMRPGWNVFTDGSPGGESPEQIEARIDRVIARVRAVHGNVALFSHGHFLRAFAARWIGLRVSDGARFFLDTATLCVVSYYRNIPAVERWNVSILRRQVQMTAFDLEKTAKALVADGKGILAADETPGTLTRRFEALKIESTADSRRDYREMLFTGSNIAQFISGVILQDETIHQKSSTGTPLADVLTQQGIIPGIKVDSGAKRLANSPGESVTEGLDGLRERLVNYRQMGARFAKWRAVMRIGEGLPSAMCVQVNAHALARYAALCQEQDLVPIVEPEVLMDGSHSIERCEEVTRSVLHATFNALFDQRVTLEGMLLKPNMVIAGQHSPRRSTEQEVAMATLRCLRQSAPAAAPGIVFLSGGQNHVTATQNLNAINRLREAEPWKLSFSYGRALQDEALEAWHGNNQNVQSGQEAFRHRARCVSAAALGKYSRAMEEELAA
jgi:fructose-bisphosphate aldolase class I